MATTQPAVTNAGSHLIGAFESAWAAIQAHNPDVPDVLIITGAGRTLGGLVLGHFAQSSWEEDAKQGKRHEMFVGGEGLARGANDVFATLLHEAAHGMAMMRKLKDTSRQGRYHNGIYKALAEEIGIEVEQHPVIGWSLTKMPASTAALYASKIEQLAEAIRLHRSDPLADLAAIFGSGVSFGDKVKLPPRTPKTRPLRTTIECACNPPRHLRMAREDWHKGPVTCGVCHTDFEEKERA
jgi:hypothetical protein